jgi:hypothetical protein
MNRPLGPEVLVPQRQKPDFHGRFFQNGTATLQLLYYVSRRAEH